MRLQRHAGWLGLWALTAMGCGADEAAPAGRFGSLRVVTGAPEMPGEIPAAESFTAEGESLGEIRGIAAAGGLVVVGTAEEALHFDEALGLQALEVWSDDPTAPLSSGPVEVMFAREDSVLVLTAAGLFHTHGARLLLSPESEAWMAVGLRAAREGAPGELWLAAEGGLALVRGEELVWFDVEGEPGTPVAMQPVGELLLVAYEDRLYELELESGLVHAVPYATGSIHAIAPGADHAAYIATDLGLYERDAEGAYTQYTLSDGAPVAVTSLAYAAKDGTFALSPAGLVVARPGEDLAGVMPAGEVAGTRITADGAGNLWSGTSGAVQRLAVGTPIGFAEDVAPILAAYCASCHAEGDHGAPRHDFADPAIVSALGATIRSRIAQGQMPPAGSEPLPGSELDIVNQWFLGGQHP